jgi:two-component system response regulator HydG
MSPVADTRAPEKASGSGTADEAADLEALREIASLARSAGPAGKRLGLCVARMAASYRSARCSILRVEPGSRTARILTSSDPLTEDQRELSLDRYPEVRWVIRNLRPLVIHEARESPILSSVVGTSRALLHASLIAVPLLSNRLEGVLLLRVPAEERRFRDEDLLFFESVAALLAGVLSDSGYEGRDGSPGPEDSEELTLDWPAGEELRFGRLLGSSPEMRDVYHTVEKIAPTDAAVLIQGESGTGKELVAREIHDRSGRAGSEFVAVNCSALPEHLLESLLFGHRRGAFTGAVADRPGLLQAADGGTLFLDEVGDLPAPMQGKLLRVIEMGEYLVVGETRPRHTDLRVVSATHRDLRSLIASGGFREDLFFRLEVVVVKLPPLREREGDLEMLVRHLVRREARASGRSITAVGGDVLEALQRHPWAGNVRELIHVLRRSVLLSSGPVLRRADLPEEVRSSVPSVRIPPPVYQLPFAEAREELLRQFTAEYVRRALERSRGNVAMAARRAGVRRQYLYRLMELAGVTPDGFRGRDRG